MLCVHFSEKTLYLWLNLTDKTAEVKWDHFLASEVPTVRPGRETTQHRS